MSIPKRRIVKGVVRFIVAGSAGTTMSRLIQQNTTPEEDKRFDNARLYVGTGILSWLVQDFVGQKTDEMIDGLADNFNSLKKNIQISSTE